LKHKAFESEITNRKKTTIFTAYYILESLEGACQKFQYGGNNGGGDSLSCLVTQ